MAARPLKRGDREAAFRLLAARLGVPAQGAGSRALLVVQHPELESFVAHDAYSYVWLFR